MIWNIREQIPQYSSMKNTSLPLGGILLIDKVEKSFDIFSENLLCGWWESQRILLVASNYISITIDPFCLSQING